LILIGDFAKLEAIYLQTKYLLLQCRIISISIVLIRI